MILASRVERSMRGSGGETDARIKAAIISVCVFVCLAHNYGCIRLCIHMVCMLVEVL